MITPCTIWSFSKISRASLVGERDNFLRAQSIVYEQCQSGLPVCRSCGISDRRGEGGKGSIFFVAVLPRWKGAPLSFHRPFLRPSGKKPHRPFPRKTRSFVLTFTASNKPAEIKGSAPYHRRRRRAMEQVARTRLEERFRFLLIHQKRKIAAAVSLRTPPEHQRLPAV